MATDSPPRSPSENWEQKRERWIEQIRQLCAQVVAWSEQEGWLTHLGSKKIEEDSLGTYEVPVLTMQAPFGRLILDPVAQDVVGADGRIDLLFFPSYDAFSIILRDDDWRIRSLDKRNVDLPWNRQAFLDAATVLAEST